jgi:hypothetical protein
MMARRILLTLALLAGCCGSAAALDGKSFEGTWTGTLKDGKAIELVIPANATEGGAVSYKLDGKPQDAPTVSVVEERLKFATSPTSFVMVGPVKEKRLPFYWQDGKAKGSAMLQKK